MPNSKFNTLNSGGMIDIKSIDESGVVELTMGPIIDLRHQKPAQNAGVWDFNESQSGAQETDLDSSLSMSNQILMSTDRVDNSFFRGLRGNRTLETRLSRSVSPQARPTVMLDYQTEENLSTELANVLNNDLDFHAELINIGAQVYEEPKTSKPRHRPILKKRDVLQDIYRKILPEINRGGFKLPYLEVEPPSGGSTSTETENTRGALVQGRPLYGRKLFTVLLIISLGAGILSFVTKLKNNIVQTGNSAVANLEQAESNLSSFEPGKALVNFSNAYEEFSKTSNHLNFMGGYIGSLIAAIPGNSQYKSARNLVEAGKLFSKAGESLAGVMVSVSKAGAILNPNDSGIALVSNLRKALLFSQANIHKASKLFADIDVSVIPENKRESFVEFQNKLPEILKLVDKGAEYSKFFESLIAVGGSKKYLVLFQNSSELRPTGGFPGSYGILSFEDGKFEDLKVDDTYNLDGQLKENIIPPKQIQHITPNWGMRDANWFIDFPTSARKVMQFFRKEAGYNIDGVITFSPVIVSKILEIVGPIELPQYNLTLDSSNFIQEIQAEVEYGGNRTQPKTILLDFAPKLLEKIYSAEPLKWIKIFNVLISSLEQKDALLYFKDFSLQSFVLENNFGGQVVNVPDNSDYLMATISNIKGSKTDLVTDNFMKLYVSHNENTGVVNHRLLITRKHNGGSEKYGFYNRPNPSYIRILIPKEANLNSVNGNDNPSLKSLISYQSSNFIKDEDLAKFESGFAEDDNGASIYEESEKKGIGFWMILDPGETKTVELNYDVPISNAKKYQLYIQKQPGLHVSNFELILKNMSNTKSSNKDVVVNSLGTTQILNYNLENDLSINAIPR